MTNEEAKEALKKLKIGITIMNSFISDDDKDMVDIEAIYMAIKALEKIDDVKNHKFLSPDNPDYFDKLPEITKGYQKGWNDALDAVINDFIYEEGENE